MQWWKGTKHRIHRTHKRLNKNTLFPQEEAQDWKNMWFADSLLKMNYQSVPVCLNTNPPRISSNYHNKTTCSNCLQQPCLQPVLPARHFCRFMIFMDKDICQSRVKHVKLSLLAPSIRFHQESSPGTKKETDNVGPSSSASASWGSIVACVYRYNSRPFAGRWPWRDGKDIWTRNILE